MLLHHITQRFWPILCITSILYLCVWRKNSFNSTQHGCNAAHRTKEYFFLFCSRKSSYNKVWCGPITGWWRNVLEIDQSSSERALRSFLSGCRLFLDSSPQLGITWNNFATFTFWKLPETILPLSLSTNDGTTLPLSISTNNGFKDDTNYSSPQLGITRNNFATFTFWKLPFQDHDDTLLLAPTGALYAI